MTLIATLVLRNGIPRSEDVTDAEKRKYAKSQRIFAWDAQTCTNVETVNWEILSMSLQVAMCLTFATIVCAKTPSAKRRLQKITSIAKPASTTMGFVAKSERLGHASV